MVQLLVDTVPIKEYFTNLFHYDIDFMDDEPSFRCLRKAFHVLNASKVLLIIEIVGLFIGLFAIFPWCLLWFLPHLLLILCTLYALKREKHRFMWPMVIFAAAQFFVWCLVSVFSFTLAIFSHSSFLGFFGQDHHQDFFVRILIVVLLKAVILFFAAFLFWRFAVFRSTRIYFEKKMDGVPTAVNTEEATPLEKIMTPI